MVYRSHTPHRIVKRQKAPPPYMAENWRFLARLKEQAHEIEMVKKTIFMQLLIDIKS